MGENGPVKSSDPLAGTRLRMSELLSVYTKIGLVGFGGGYAVLALIRSEVVERHRWLDSDRFDRVVEMAAFAPGATTVNVLAGIAFRLAGWRGLIAGTAALLWPSFLLVLGLARLTRVLQNAWLVGALRGIEVAVVGLLVDVIVTLAREVSWSWVTAVLAIAAGALVLMGWNPALALLLVAVAGLLDFVLRRPQRRS